MISPLLVTTDESPCYQWSPKFKKNLFFSNIVDFVTSFLSRSQFGFLCGRSTLHQLLTFFNILLSCPSQTDVIYLDFRKAFDLVAHNKLLYKIWIFGITGNLWLWLRAYLTNRAQFVTIGQSSSFTLPVVSGVPQGSILSPVLDLPPALSFAKVLLFMQMTLSASCPFHHCKTV